MKFTETYRFLPLMAGAAVMLAGGQASAQTVTVDADVEVSNTLTLTIVDDLDFGKIAAVDNDATKVASLALDPVTGLGAPATTGAPAQIAIIDSTNAKNALITVEDGANGATININITNVIDPANAGKTFTLTLFESAYNAGASTARTAATPWAETFSSAFAAGVNTLKIGASIKTNDVVYADGNYDGGFDVTFSY